MTLPASAVVAAMLEESHLDPRRLERYRKAHRTDAVAVLSGVLTSTAAEMVAASLQRDVAYLPFRGVYPQGTGRRQPPTRGEFVSPSTWTRASRSNRLFSFSALPPASRFIGRHPRTPLEILCEELAGVTFRSLVSAITELPLGDVVAEARRMSGGEFFGPHSDDRGERCVAFALHLSREWSPEAGGVLKFKRDGDSTLDVSPDFNSLVLFDVTRAGVHWISHVAPGRTRVSVYGWFLRPPRQLADANAADAPRVRLPDKEEKWS